MTDLDLPSTVEAAAREYLLALADDDFVLGHRLTDWVGLGPTMEEDNTLASIAQDELGHARLWYEVLADDQDLDDLALNRPPAERRNSVIVEADHADYADVIAIGACYHAAERRLLEALGDGDVSALSDRATVALAEEPFHREHASLWLDRLPATDEGRDRLSRALTEALPRAADLFAFGDGVVQPLLDAGVLARDPVDLAAEWKAELRDRIADLPVDVDDDALAALGSPPERNGRAGEHTDGLVAVIDEIHAGDLVGDHPVLRYGGA